MASGQQPGELHGSTGPLLSNTESLLTKLNNRHPGEYTEHKRQLRALSKLLQDPLFQQVYKANLAVDKGQVAEEDAIEVAETSRRGLESAAPGSFGENIASEKGFVSAEETIEEFLERVK